MLEWHREIEPSRQIAGGEQFRHMERMQASARAEGAERTLFLTIADVGQSAALITKMGVRQAGAGFNSTRAPLRKSQGMCATA